MWLLFFWIQKTEWCWWWWRPNKFVIFLWWQSGLLWVLNVYGTACMCVCLMMTLEERIVIPLYIIYIFKFTTCKWYGVSRKEWFVVRIYRYLVGDLTIFLCAGNDCFRNNCDLRVWEWLTLNLLFVDRPGALLCQKYYRGLKFPLIKL